MQTMTRESWTDERLDEFGKRIDERFDRMEGNFTAMQGDIKAMQGEINQRFDGVHRTMVHGIIGICGVIFTAFGIVLAYVATQV